MDFTVDNCPGSGRLRPQSLRRQHQQTTATCGVCGARLVVPRPLERAQGQARIPRHRALRDDGGVVTRWRSMA
jgi:hypothetical protein